MSDDFEDGDDFPRSLGIRKHDAFTQAAVGKSQAEATWALPPTRRAAEWKDFFDPVTAGHNEGVEIRSE